jgi:hypothetical protein
VSYYKRFLAITNEKVPAPRLAEAQDELDRILARIARVNVTISPAIDGVIVSVDGNELGKFESPLLLPPGDHKVTARAAGRRDAERNLHLASGDELNVDLVLAELPPPPPEKPATITVVSPAPIGPEKPRRFAISAGFGTNLAHADDTGTVSFGGTATIGSRLEVGVEGVVRAWALIPSSARSRSPSSTSRCRPRPSWPAPWGSACATGRCRAWRSASTRTRALPARDTARRFRPS